MSSSRRLQKHMTFVRTWDQLKTFVISFCDFLEIETLVNACAVGEPDGHPNRGETRQSQHRPLLHAVETPKHHGDVDEDNHEADRHHDCITEMGLSGFQVGFTLRWCPLQCRSNPVQHSQSQRSRRVSCLWKWNYQISRQKIFINPFPVRRKTKGKVNLCWRRRSLSSASHSRLAASTNSPVPMLGKFCLYKNQNMLHVAGTALLLHIYNDMQYIHIAEKDFPSLKTIAIESFLTLIRRPPK